MKFLENGGMNPDHELREQQDQLLVRWLFSSISQEILSQLIS